MRPAAKESKRYTHAAQTTEKSKVGKSATPDSMGKKLAVKRAATAAKDSPQKRYRIVERPQPVALCEKKQLKEASIAKDAAVATATL